MTGHDFIQGLLPLAITGDLAPDEMRMVRQHLEGCAECRLAHEQLAFLGGMLRGLPVPQPRAELVARVHHMAAVAATQQPGARDTAVLVPLIAASWILALVTWPWVRDAVMWMLAVSHWPRGEYVAVFAAYSIWGLLLAGVAAFAVGRHAGTIGRMQ